MINNEEEIAVMTKIQCENALKVLAKTYDFNETIVRYTDEIDQVVNCLLRLERRLANLELESPEEFIVKPEPRPSRVKIANQKIFETTFKRVSTPHGIFANLTEACEQLGLQRKTLISYISNRGHNWKYLDDDTN